MPSPSEPLAQAPQLLFSPSCRTPGSNVLPDDVTQALSTHPSPPLASHCVRRRPTIILSNPRRSSLSAKRCVPAQTDLEITHL